MSKKVLRERRKSGARRTGGRRILAATLLFAAGLFAALTIWIVNASKPSASALESSAASLGASSDAVADEREQRPVYPYSIIPGGAATVEELSQAIEADPVVAAHFASFDLSRTRVETLKEPRVVHVSYRKGEDVFWTRKPVVIPAGERVLTDGTNMARVRCGNCLSDKPGTVSADEPIPDVLDTPEQTGTPSADPSDAGDPDGGDPADPGAGGPSPGPAATPGGGVPAGPGSGPTSTPGGGTPGGVGGPAGSSGGSGGPSNRRRGRRRLRSLARNSNRFDWHRARAVRWDPRRGKRRNVARRFKRPGQVPWNAWRLYTRWLDAANRADPARRFDATRRIGPRRSRRAPH